MAMNAVWLKLEDSNLADTLRKASAELDGAEGEVVLDFSSVHRIDASALRSIEALAAIAHDKGVKVALRGVNVSIYKVLKLARLDPQFSFLT